MNKTIISFDIDGVLAQFGREFTKAIRAEFPQKEVPYDFEPTTWEYTDVLTADEFPLVWQRTIRTPRLWENMLPYAENVEALAGFISREHNNFDIYYITSRVDTPGDSAFSQTSRWLMDHDLLWYNTSLLVVKKADQKIPIIRGLEIEASVDDHLPTVIAASKVPGHKAFVYSRPWNKQGRPDGLNTVSNLQEYLTEMVKLRENQK